MRHGFLKTPLFKGHRTKIITQNAAMPFLVPNPRLGRGMPMPNSKLGKGASAPNPTLVRDAPAPNSTLGYGGSVSDHSWVQSQGEPNSLWAQCVSRTQHPLDWVHSWKVTPHYASRTLGLG